MKATSALISVVLLALAGVSLAQEGDKPKAAPEPLPPSQPKDPFAQPLSQPKDPFVDDENQMEIMDDEVGRAIGVLVEFIQVEHRTANALLREHAANGSNAQPLRDELEALMEAGEAELMETGWVHARSGQRALTESITEMMYPKEWDPADIPETLSVSGSITTRGEVEPSSEALFDAGQFHGRVNPAAWVERNVGFSMEVDPVLGADGRTIDLNLAPEIIFYMGEREVVREGTEETPSGLEHVTTPDFYTMRITTSVSVTSGSYALLTIQTPPDNDEDRVFVLIRADVIIVR